METFLGYSVRYTNERGALAEKPQIILGPLPAPSEDLVGECPTCSAEVRYALPVRLTYEQVDRVEFACPNGHEIRMRVTRRG